MSAICIILILSLGLYFKPISVSPAVAALEIVPGLETNRTQIFRTRCGNNNPLKWQFSKEMGNPATGTNFLAFVDTSRAINQAEHCTVRLYTEPKLLSLYSQQTAYCLAKYDPFQRDEADEKEIMAYIWKSDEANIAQTTNRSLTFTFKEFECVGPKVVYPWSSRRNVGIKTLYLIHECGKSSTQIVIFHEQKTQSGNSSITVIKCRLCFVNCSSDHSSAVQELVCCMGNIWLRLFCVLSVLWQVLM